MRRRTWRNRIAHLQHREICCSVGGGLIRSGFDDSRSIRRLLPFLRLRSEVLLFCCFFRTICICVDHGGPPGSLASVYIPTRAWPAQAAPNPEILPKPWHLCTLPRPNFSRTLNFIQGARFGSHGLHRPLSLSLDFTIQKRPHGPHICAKATARLCDMMASHSLSSPIDSTNQQLVDRRSQFIEEFSLLHKPTSVRKEMKCV
jgi:hypothetical protein